MKIHWCLLQVLLILLPTSAGAEVRTLADFYSHLDQAASVLKTQADLEAQRFHLQASEAQKGWEVFGGVSGGYQKAPMQGRVSVTFLTPWLESVCAIPCWEVQKDKIVRLVMRKPKFKLRVFVMNGAKTSCAFYGRELRGLLERRENVGAE